MTLETGLALLSILSAALVAGRVVFSTEAKVETAMRTIDECRGSMKAIDAVVSEQRAAHMGLVERVSAIGSIVGEKASVESVEGLRESVEGLRRDLGGHLTRIENKIDEQARFERNR